MQIADLLNSERTLFANGISSKKRALEELCQLFAQSLNIDIQELSEAFFERERLGSTAIGHGVAIPHIRSSFAKQPLGALLVLNQPLDFNALTAEPVDIIFGLIVPETSTDQHLKILKMLAEQFRREAFRQQLRQAQDSQTLYQLAIEHTSLVI